jgi:oxygen-independent coproporphyrinogen-3 oxidase
MSWYEVSNWSLPGGECRHNLGYWHDDDWWGVGPGAHSHVAGTRWWNAKHPKTYADLLLADSSPESGREVLSEQQRRMERIMLGLRLAEGLPTEAISSAASRHVEQHVARGHLDPGALADRRLVLTDQGRLLADAVIRDLVD